MLKTRTVRISREMAELVNHIKAQYLIKGKNSPSTAEITKRLVSMINKEEIMYEKFIKFK